MIRCERRKTTGLEAAEEGSLSDRAPVASTEKEGLNRDGSALATVEAQKHSLEAQSMTDRDGLRLDRISEVE